MRKQILIFSKGRSLVLGETDVQIDNEKPIKRIEVEMDDDTFQKWVNNPQKYKKAIDALIEKTKIKKDVKIMKALTNEEKGG